MQVSFSKQGTIGIEIWESVRVSEENVHSATEPQKCRDMARKYGWKLKLIKMTRDPILKVDCVFRGKQTSFEDERYE